MGEDNSNSALAYIYEPKTVLGQLPHHFQSHLPHQQLFPTHNFTWFLLSSTMASSADQTTTKSPDTSCSNSVFNETLATQLATNVSNETKPWNEDDTITTLSKAISKVVKHMNQKSLKGSPRQKLMKGIQSAWQGTPSRSKKAAMQRFHKTIMELSTATDALASFAGWLSRQSRALIMQCYLSVAAITESNTPPYLTIPEQMMVDKVRDVRKNWDAVKTAAGEDYVKSSIARWPNDVQEQYERLGELVAELSHDASRSLSEARFARTWSL